MVVARLPCQPWCRLFKASEDNKLLKMMFIGHTRRRNPPQIRFCIVVTESISYSTLTRRLLDLFVWLVYHRERFIEHTFYHRGDNSDENNSLAHRDDNG